MSMKRILPDKVFYCKSQGVAVHCHPNSSMIIKESFEHCSLTPKSPQTYPSERVFSIAFKCDMIFHRLTACQISLKLRNNPRFSMLEMRSQCIRKSTWISHIVPNWCGHRHRRANYMSSESSVIWWGPSNRDVMSALTFYFPRRQLFALHRIDIDQGSLLITRINLNPGLDKKLRPS